MELEERALKARQDVEEQIPLRSLNMNNLANSCSNLERRQEAMELQQKV